MSAPYAVLVYDVWGWTLDREPAISGGAYWNWEDALRRAAECAANGEVVQVFNSKGEPVASLAPTTERPASAS